MLPICKSLREQALRIDEESSTGMGFKFLGLPRKRKSKSLGKKLVKTVKKEAYNNNKNYSEYMSY